MYAGARLSFPISNNRATDACASDPAEPIYVRVRPFLPFGRVNERHMTNHRPTMLSTEAGTASSSPAEALPPERSSESEQPRSTYRDVVCGFVKPSAKPHQSQLIRDPPLPQGIHERRVGKRSGVIPPGRRTVVAMDGVYFIYKRGVLIVLFDCSAFILLRIRGTNYGARTVCSGQTLRLRYLFRRSQRKR